MNQLGHTINNVFEVLGALLLLFTIVILLIRLFITVKRAVASRSTRKRRKKEEMIKLTTEVRQLSAQVVKLQKAVNGMRKELHDALAPVEEPDENSTDIEQRTYEPAEDETEELE